YSTDTWVAYKVFGVMGLMGLFFVVQGVYLQGILNDIAKHKDSAVSSEQ
ncbi:MAG: septation protein IspZ, partial [Neisseriaceae bacterium]|nr:septation protein IspZ [Neisseriaceae bacterium]